MMKLLMLMLMLMLLMMMTTTESYSIINNNRGLDSRYSSRRSAVSDTRTSVYEDSAITDLLVSVGGNSDSLALENTFRVFTTSSTFVNEFWQKKPFLCKESIRNIAGGFGMKDVKESVDSDFIEAGRGTFSEKSGGWNMATVSTPRGSSFEDAKLRFEDVQMALKQTSGTVVFNSAGGFIPKLAGVCLDALNAFQYPTALNMYLTNAGQKTSAPPHTDKQDVFVLQTQGFKRWRVFAPPPTARMPKADPYARGKNKDVLDLSELSEPLIDHVMSPGQVLYVPGGFPHTTDTVTGINSDSDPSVHLTLGVDSHIWDLSYAGLRKLALMKAGINDKAVLTKTDYYWTLQDALPLGFLAPDRESSIDEHKKRIFEGLISRLRLVEPTKWPESIPDSEIVSRLSLHDLYPRIVQHHADITDLFGKMYADVAFKITPTKMDLSFFRSQPYFTQLENTMEGYLTWAKATKPSAAGRGGGFAKRG